MVNKSLNQFLNKLKRYRHILPKQTISTIRGQAINGNLKAAEIGLNNSINKSISNKDKMINAHRGARYIKKTYKDINYKDQLGLQLKDINTMLR